jgi:hypothetical protein
MIVQIVLNDFCEFGRACAETDAAEADERRQIVAGAVLARFRSPSTRPNYHRATFSKTSHVWLRNALGMNAAN